MITMAAMKAGFSGGLVVDYPNSTRAKKFFLTLMAGPPMEVPKAKGTCPTLTRVAASTERIVLRTRQLSTTSLWTRDITRLSGTQ
jgi:hypothetical protein